MQEKIPFERKNIILKGCFIYISIPSGKFKKLLELRSGCEAG